MTRPRPQRIRRLHTRSKAGCITCKIRRIKCDQTRPSCQRCTSTGRKCDGYETIPTHSRDSPTLPLSPGTVFNSREKRAFDFFLKETGPGLTVPIDAAFWIDDIPRLCHANPAIWDALVSISTLVEHPQWSEAPTGRAIVPSITNGNYHWALTLYNRSISKFSISQKPDRTTLGLAIVTCMLYICIEFLQDNVQQSIKLFSLAQRLLKDFWSSPESNEAQEITSIIKKTVSPLLVRLSCLVTFTLRNPFIDVTSLDFGSMSHDFASIEDARTAFYPMVAGCHAFSWDSAPYKEMEKRHVPVPLDILNEQNRILQALRRWHTSFTNLLARIDQKTIDPCLVSLMLIQYNVAFIWIASSCSSSESIYDQWIYRFRNIVRHSRISLEQSCSWYNTATGRSRESVGRRTFTFDMSFAASLYFVVTACRHPGIRREALRLMSCAARKEGIWKSDPAARMAETIMDIEEEGLDLDEGSLTVDSEDVPLPGDAQRLHNVGLRQDADSTSEPKQWLVTFTRYQTDGSGNLQRIDGARPLKESPGQVHLGAPLKSHALPSI